MEPQSCKRLKWLVWISYLMEVGVWELPGVQSMLKPWSTAQVLLISMFRISTQFQLAQSRLNEKIDIAEPWNLTEMPKYFRRFLGQRCSCDVWNEIAFGSNGTPVCRFQVSPGDTSFKEGDSSAEGPGRFLLLAPRKGRHFSRALWNGRKGKSRLGIISKRSQFLNTFRFN